MAIVIEDGTGKSDAQAYCDYDYFMAYLAERGIVSAWTQSQVEAALVVSAKDWIDSHSFAYEVLEETQALQWPREVYEFPSNIPLANCKAAYLHLQGLLLVDLTTLNTSGIIDSESKSLGALSKSVTYKSGSAQTYSRVLPKDLTNLLRPYLYASSGMVIRG